MTIAGITEYTEPTITHKHRLEDYYNIHKGETGLLVGVGPNLKLTPPHLFNYPSISVNSVFRYEGWRPTYYVGVDERLRVENGAEICEVYKDIPKFFPSPDWDSLQGENIYRFVHREGGNLYVGGQLANHRESLTRYGITYYRVMGAAMQIAMYMGFSTLLMIGIQHKEGAPTAHFWGEDVKAVANQPIEHWMNEYQQWAHGSGMRVLNISEDTYVPENVIPRDDYRNWTK